MTNPFFIFSSGRPRYGDLAGHRNRERLLDDMLSTSRLRAWDPPPDRQRVVARISSPTFAGLVRAVFEAWAAQCGKDIWGDKTPQHIVY